MSTGTAAWLLGMEQTGRAAQQDASGYYPPALTGMRGSTDGSFETAHSLRDGTFWKTAGPPIDTRETYDLIVIGGGISGLAAAHFYRAGASPSARILILDNHDDFGGHAKRNELSAGGRMLLANGGTWAIESPYPYSREARGLMKDLGIDPAALEAKCVDRNAYSGLGTATFFDKETFGADRLVAGSANGDKLAEFLAQSPLSTAAKSDIVRLQTGNADYMPGVSQAEKKGRLSRVSYKDFLLNLVKTDEQVVQFYRSRTHDLFGVGIDAVSALDCWAMRYPGFQGMSLDRVPTPRVDFTPGGDLVEETEPYYFHFPDGNASIARMLVRALIPAVAPGSTAEDVVTAKFDYGRLDREGAAGLHCGRGAKLDGVQETGRARRVCAVHVPHRSASRSAGEHWRLPLSAIARGAYPAAHDPHTVPAWIIRARAAPLRTDGVADHPIRHFRVKDSGSTGPHSGTGRIRSGARHHRHYRESLSPRLRL